MRICVLIGINEWLRNILFVGSQTCCSSSSFDNVLVLIQSCSCRTSISLSCGTPLRSDEFCSSVLIYWPSAATCVSPVHEILEKRTFLALRTWNHLIGCSHRHFGLQNCRFGRGSWQVRARRLSWSNFPANIHWFWKSRLTRWSIIALNKWGVASLSIGRWDILLPGLWW